MCQKGSKRISKSNPLSYQVDDPKYNWTNSISTYYKNRNQGHNKYEFQLNWDLESLYIERARIKIEM